MRSVPEWVGKTPDTKIPPRVRERVFLRHNGVCHVSGQKIAPGSLWDCDHVIALINGGENRESNLAPILRGKPHKDKTAADVAEKAKVSAIRQRHLGITQPKGKLKSAGFPKKPGRIPKPDNTVRRNLFTGKKT